MRKSKSSKALLDLSELATGRPGLTPAYGAALAEAAAVCLQSHGHTPGVSMTTGGAAQRIFILEWHRPDDQAVGCWADEEFTTEQGAYGVALALVEELTSWTVIERSRKGTGFDYWLGEVSSGEPLFQKRARLEVSGIRKGGRHEIQYRMKQKLQQIRRSVGTLPGIVIVVEFSRPHSEVKRR